MRKVLWWVGNFSQILPSADFSEKPRTVCFYEKIVKTNEQTNASQFKRNFQESVLTSRLLMLLWDKPCVGPMDVAKSLCTRPNSALISPRKSTVLNILQFILERSVLYYCDSIKRLAVDAFLSHFWKQRLFLCHSVVPTTGVLADIQLKSVLV